MNLKSLVTLAVAILITSSLAAGQSPQGDSTRTNEAPTATPASAPKPEKVYRVGGDVKAPRAILQVQPQLDAQQKKGHQKQERTVTTVFCIVIGKDGTVRSAVVSQSTDHKFDAEAIKVIKQWTFEPATKKGVPVAVEQMIGIDFQVY
jgi:protein TonB